MGGGCKCQFTVAIHPTAKAYGLPCDRWVTSASGNDEIHSREKEALHRASEELRCNNMTIITSNYEGKIGNVKCIPVWKWLLSGEGVLTRRAV